MVSCGWLSPPAKGKKEGTSYLQGSTVRFSCDDDYTLKGSEERVCQENGQWSGEEAACKVPRMNIWWNPSRPMILIFTNQQWQICSVIVFDRACVNVSSYPSFDPIKSGVEMHNKWNHSLFHDLLFEEFFCVSENFLQDYWLWLKSTRWIRNRKNVAPTPKALKPI